MARLPAMGIPRSGTSTALGESPLIRYGLLVALGMTCAWPMEGPPLWAQTTGTIRGIVRVAASSKPATVDVTIDQKICGPTVPDERLVTSAAGGLANAVIVLDGVRASGTAPAAEVVNEKCRFAPHIQVVRPGATLRVGSMDDTLHTTHAYAEDNSSLFNVAIPIAGLMISRTLARAGTVRLTCDTHPWMRGFVVVTDSRAAVSAADGRFELTAVPPGTHTLHIWHEQLKPATEKVTVGPGGSAEVTITLQ